MSAILLLGVNGEDLNNFLPHKFPEELVIYGNVLGPWREILSSIHGNTYSDVLKHSARNFRIWEIKLKDE